MNPNHTHSLSVLPGLEHAAILVTPPPSKRYKEEKGKNKTRTKNQTKKQEFYLCCLYTHWSMI